VKYSQALEYLYQQLPMFHRIGVAAYKANLDNIHALSDLLHHPEKKFKSIHIAGTNGKGSVSNMLASVFQEAGYKTGLFTSPHLKDFRERIRINGKMIGEGKVIAFIEEHRLSFETIKPSFFEWTTGLAFSFFADEEVDIAIIETGLGGRLDSTNIILPELSVITNISYDHMQLLGNTLEKIAFEKAGIIKENIPVVVGERQAEIIKVFVQKASELNSEILFASENFQAERKSFSDNGQEFRVTKEGRVQFENLFVDLSGAYQQKNICTVLQSLEILKEKFPELNENIIRSGLKNIIKNTGLMGRWQVFGKTPLTIADVAHNEAGIKFVMQQLKETIASINTKSKSQGRLHIIFGMVNDKDPSVVLSLLPQDAIYYFCNADIPRALDAMELKNKADVFNLKGESFKSVNEAFISAQSNAKENDVVFVGGSTFVVAEVI